MSTLHARLPDGFNLDVMMIPDFDGYSSPRRFVGIFAVLLAATPLEARFVGW